MVDADCRLADGAIDRLALTCAATGRPVQALYLMTAPENSQINHQAAEFSWRVKNWLRPLGLHALNLPCQLMGTGMAFPWDVIRPADLGSGQIVEDLKLGLDLTLAGHPPVFCPSARVTSEFASSVKGAGSQRQRWEQGHLEMILKTAPRLLTKAVTRRDLDLLAITLDLAVPPLSLLGMLVLGIFGIILTVCNFRLFLGGLCYQHSQPPGFRRSHLPCVAQMRPRCRTAQRNLIDTVLRFPKDQTLSSTYFRQNRLPVDQN